MKWPSRLVLVRHATSAYNILKAQKEQDAEYQEFKRLFDQDSDSSRCAELAHLLKSRYALSVSGPDTPIIPDECRPIKQVGRKLPGTIDRFPDIVYVSPFLRARETLKYLHKGWPQLRDAKTVEDDRLREQEHGLAELYNDWRIFQTLHPEQRLAYQRNGSYWYRYPQGENVADVRERLRSWTTTLIREHSGEVALVITHHLAILSFRANFERLNAEEFIRLDHEDKPINLGVTVYRGDPRAGGQGKLILDSYNMKLYDEPAP